MTINDFIQRWFRAEIALCVTAVLLIGLLLWAPPGLYLWLKALHVIAVIAWMAGMLYLPRLFVYHCEAEAGSKQSETFKVMERRLLRAIINPAMA
jgi:putative membrane protein